MANKYYLLTYLNSTVADKPRDAFVQMQLVVWLT